MEDLALLRPEERKRPGEEQRILRVDHVPAFLVVPARDEPIAHLLHPRSHEVLHEAQAALPAPREDRLLLAEEMQQHRRLRARRDERAAVHVPGRGQLDEATMPRAKAGLEHIPRTTER